MFVVSPTTIAGSLSHWSCYTIEEVGQHLPEIAEKTGSTEEELLAILAVLPFKTVSESTYGEMMERAENEIGGRDITDASLLAAYYAVDGDVIWTDDKDFEAATGASMNTTAEMLLYAETSASGSIQLFDGPEMDPAPEP